MDPVSALGLVESVLAIANLVGGTLRRLSVLKPKYKQADFTVDLVVVQLCTIQAALTQLIDLQRLKHIDLRLAGTDITPPLSNSLNGCDSLVASLATQLGQLGQLEKQDNTRLTAKGKLSFLWHDQDIKEYLVLLDHHVNALKLLLQVVQW